jgi:putative transposase
MSTYTQICCHIVFASNERKSALTEDRRRDLFHYTWRIVKKRQSRLCRINGTLDHIHILSNLHPSQSLADFVKNIKGGFIVLDQGERCVPRVYRLAAGIRRIHSYKQRHKRFDGIHKNRDALHEGVSSKDEMRNLLIEAGIEFEEKYFV